MIQYSSAKQDRKNRLSTHKTHNAQHIYARTTESNPISYLHNIYFHSENFLDYDSSILSTHPPPHCTALYCTVLYRFYLISCSTAKSTSLFTFKKKVSRKDNTTFTVTFKFTFTFDRVVLCGKNWINFRDRLRLLLGQYSQLNSTQLTPSLPHHIPFHSIPFHSIQHL